VRYEVLRANLSQAVRCRGARTRKREFLRTSFVARHFVTTRMVLSDNVTATLDHFCEFHEALRGFLLAAVDFSFFAILVFGVIGFL
jgi:hypothetical protein